MIMQHYFASRGKTGQIADQKTVVQFDNREKCSYFVQLEIEYLNMINTD